MINYGTRLPPKIEFSKDSGQETDSSGGGAGQTHSLVPFAAPYM